MGGATTSRARRCRAPSDPAVVGPGWRRTAIRCRAPWVGLCGLALGCSLTAIDNEACTEHADCRAVFGLGSVCDAGYCSAPQLHPRCERTYPSDLFERQAAYTDRIVIGSLFSYTEHVDTLQAAELALRQANEHDGLQGTLFAMVHCDYTAGGADALDDETAAAETATYMAQALGVPAIVGPRGSARATAAFNAIRDDEVVLISPSATSPDLTALDGLDPTFENPGMLWRTAPPDSLQSEVIASDMLDRGVSSVAIIHQSGPYGDGLKDLFVDRFSGAGGATAEFPFQDSFGEAIADVGEGLTTGAWEEVLFISSDIGDFVDFFNGASANDALTMAYGGAGVGIFLPDAAFNAQLLEQTSASGQGLFVKVRGTRPAPAQGPIYDAFAAAYAATFKSDPASSGFNPHSYDAAWLVLYGTAWSLFNEGEIRGLGVARGLRQVSAGEERDIRPSQWVPIVERFRLGESIDVRGASGPLDYDPDTEETTAPISLWVIVDDPATSSGYDFEEVSRTQPD